MSLIDLNINQVQSDTARPAPRIQRAPPPPPIQYEPSTPFDFITSPSGAEITPSYTESFNEFNKDAEDTCPLLLFEFTELFDKFDYEAVRSKILSREMTTSPFTTVLWRIFLHCLPRDSSHWNQMIDTSRDQYSELAETYLLDLEKIRKHNDDTKNLNHPLSQEENSLWNQYYVYEELKENIDQDVRRTCQEIPFFQQKYVLDLLLKVLYVHSRHHGQTIPYRQGMHEILAIIVYLIHMESVIINEYWESNELMKKLYDPEYLAHDSYAIYEKIMEHLQQYYDFKPNTVARRKSFTLSEKALTLFQRPNNLQPQINDTVMRVNAIYEHLKDHDPALYEKLEDLSIEPTVYGIRWLRLLFGREIPFNSIPTLWTVIFCYDESFGFINYFFLALLIRIGQLFKKHGVSEYSFCLQYLMQPNVISDVESIILKALSLERVSRRDLSSSFNSQTLPNRSIMLETQKPTSPSQKYLQNPLIHSTRIRSTTSTQFSKLTPTDPSKESEMANCPGRETREQLNNNMQIQKNCAKFINQFIERIRRGVRSLYAPNEEEVLIQLTGLEQIANVLEGTLAFDDKSLQSLLNYQYKEKLIANDNTDTA